MRSHTIQSFRFTANRMAQASAAIAAALVIAACGGGGTTTDNGVSTTSTVSNNGAKLSGLRALPADYSTRGAASYSPFRTGDRGAEIPTEAHIKQDLDLLHASGVGLIRLFDSQAKTSALILKVISDNPLLDIKVHLGAYVNTFEYWGQSASKQASIQADNNDELARCVALANSYPDIVEAVSVGNETMVSWSSVPISTRQMAIYIRTVRSQIVQPVTSDDDWSFYSGGQPHHPAENQATEVLAEVDFVSMHTYAHEAAKFDLFDWRQKSAAAGQERANAMMVAAMNKTKQDYAVVRSFMDRVGKANLPIVIGETGWKGADSGGSNGQYRYYASPANQRRYVGDLLTWSNGIKAVGSLKNVFYFESFDEPWKGGDDKWGLFNVARQARYVIQDLHPNNAVLTANATWTYEPVVSTDLLYFKSPIESLAVSSSQYYIYGDLLASGATKAPQYWTNPVTINGLWFDPYDSGVAYSEIATAPVTPSTGKYMQFAPASTLGTSNGYGWGVLNHTHTEDPPAATYDGFTSRNLSAFANGHMNFWVKTNNYPGKIQVGVSTDSADGVTQNFLVSLDSASGTYGYCTTNQWCLVSIPLSAFAAIPSGATAPTSPSSPDWSRVIAPFILQDVFSQTGKAVGTDAVNNLPTIFIDEIYFSQQ